MIRLYTKAVAKAAAREATHRRDHEIARARRQPKIGRARSTGTPDELGVEPRHATPEAFFTSAPRMYHVTETYGVTYLSFGKIHNMEVADSGNPREVDTRYHLGFGVSAPLLSITVTRGANHVLKSTTGYTSATLSAGYALSIGNTPNKADPIAGNPSKPEVEQGVGSPTAGLGWTWVFGD